jgi:cobyric acid synthase
MQENAMKHRIGLVYLPGALPCFESFGNLPTDLVRADACIEDKSASEVLDMIIIPGGSLVESQTVNANIKREIQKMADKDKFVLGICSGFQILSRGTDIGRLSTKPILREGMGLLDAELKPLICTDQIKATVIRSSCLTNKVGAQVTGFHCHTYGDIHLHNNSKAILISHANSLNYFEKSRDIISGVANKDGNVVGILPHAILDQNPFIVEGIAKMLDISSRELEQIRAANANLVSSMKSEVGIETGILLGKTRKTATHQTLLITALESGSGKTFIVTGLAAGLKKRGIKVGVVKIGADIRDSVPALYLIKEPIREYSSIKVANCGWKSHTEMIKKANEDYDFLIIEGAMDSFAGILFNQLSNPRSTAEIAAALGVSTVIVAGCDKEGVEGGLVGVLNYVNLLKKLGVKVVGVILNRMSMGYLTDDVRLVMKQAFEKAGVELLGIVPYVDIEGRGLIPEVEIKYEEFGDKALTLSEQSLDFEKIMKVAAPAIPTELNYEIFHARFRSALLGENLGEFNSGV